MWACDPALTSTILQSYQAVGPLFVQTLQTFFAAQCAMAGDHLWPADATNLVLEDSNYDFVVVGAGSAGSVVANRLSEIPDWKVLLIEAGGNPTLATEIPQLFFSNMKTQEDWGYKTQPQEGACRSYKTKGCAWPRGKVLGGCSSINAMMYIRGNKIDYDEWAADGNIGWKYDEVLPYFKKSENIAILEQPNNFHSRGGYLNIANDNKLAYFEEIIMKAVIELGVKKSSDINGASQMGVTKASATVINGTRQSTARAFLHPIRDRKNLHVVKNAHVTKFLFKSGAINSPQLLMLSGVGPKEHLERLGIEVKSDVPVGQNLQDHVFHAVYYTLPGNRDINSLSSITEMFIQSVLHREGPLADISPNKILTFVNTTDANSQSPDFQYQYVLFPPSNFDILDMLDKHDLNEEVQMKFRNMNKDKFTLLVFNILSKPKSRGKILLNSKDPFEHPLIYANYFDHSDDMKTMLRGIKQHSLKLGETKAFKDIGFKPEWLDVNACKQYSKENDDYLECLIRELTFSLYHPTSTVKMGPENDPSAVVDPDLRVKNVKGLRVIDASVMPSIVRGNTNAPTIMIGEKGADMIKRYWLSQHTEF